VFFKLIKTEQTGESLQYRNSTKLQTILCGTWKNSFMAVRKLGFVMDQCRAGDHNRPTINESLRYKISNKYIEWFTGSF
jgi:hypothetical protein